MAYMNNSKIIKKITNPLKRRIFYFPQFFENLICLTLVNQSCYIWLISLSWRIFFLWTILGSNCHFGFSSLFKCENDMRIQEVCMRFWNNDLNYIQDVFTHSHRTKCHDCTYKLMRSVQICFSYDFSEYLMSKTQKSHN